MNDNALGGLLLVTIGVGVAWLWYRGYFNSVITNATGGLAGATAKRDFTVFNSKAVTLGSKLVTSS
jgi:hypothetical protein